MLKATVITRWDRITSLRWESNRATSKPRTDQEDYAPISAPPEDRRKVVELDLLDGRTFRGGHRKLTWRVLDDPAGGCPRLRRTAQSDLFAASE